MPGTLPGQQEAVDVLETTSCARVAQQLAPLAPPAGRLRRPADWEVVALELARLEVHVTWANQRRPISERWIFFDGYGLSC